MTTMEREAVAALALLAAWADGTQSETERESLRKALEQLGPVSDGVFQRVAMQRTTLEEEARRISDAGHKQMAFDMAVGVCASDGATSPNEKAFLMKLAGVLGIDPAAAQREVQEHDQLVDLTQPATIPPPLPMAATAAAAGAGGAVAAAAATPPDGSIAKQVDDTILTNSVIAAALELLPQSIASFAVVPVQTRMVYRVGALYGYKLDSGHIKEFIATVGLGMGGQFVESYARKLVSGLLGKYLGKTAGRIGEKATGPMMTFATSYALGQVAKAYYASGRKLSMSALQGQFSKLFEDAKTIYASREGDIKATAAKLNPGQIMNLVRGA